MPESGECPTCGHIIAMSADECRSCGETNFLETKTRSKRCTVCGGDGIFPKETKGVLPEYCHTCGGSGGLNCIDFYDTRTGKKKWKSTFNRDSWRDTPTGNRTVVSCGNGNYEIKPRPEPPSKSNDAKVITWLIFILVMAIVFGNWIRILNN